MPFLMLFIALLANHCSSEKTNSTAVRKRVDKSEVVKVKLAIVVPPRSFNSDSNVKLTLNNHDDLTTLDRNRKYDTCITSASPSEGESTICPNGMQYNPEKVNSEVYEQLASEINGQWILITEHLSIGKPFSIAVDGQSSDKCNTVSAHFTGVLEDHVMKLDDLVWIGTEMICAPTEDQLEIIGETTLRLGVESSVFDPASIVKLTLNNHDNLAAHERNLKYNNCSISTSPSGDETMTCPNGMQYNPEKVNSEVYERLASEINGEWVLITKHLSIGKSFSIEVDGISSDKCNDVSAYFTGVLESHVMTLDDLTWIGTEMVCVSPED